MHERGAVFSPSTLSFDDHRAVSEDKYQHLERNRAFVTNRMHIGSTCDHVNEGDLVCIIASASLPFILRQVDNAYRKLFKLVEPAYVHGKTCITCFRFMC